MTIHRWFIWIFIGMVALGVPLAALADSAEETTSEDTDVVVTATRTPTEESEAPGTVDVVTHEELEEENPGTQDLSEYLSMWLGVQLNSNGYDGSVTSVNLRGAGSEQMLVMLNGISLTNPQNGMAPLNFIPMDMINRVEVAEGPLSALYGEDAMGGVINIIPGGKTGGKFRLGGGSFASGDLHLSYLWDKAGIMLGRSRSDGYRPNNDYDGNWQYGFVRPTLGQWDMELGYYRYQDDKGSPGCLLYGSTPNAEEKSGQQAFYMTARSKFSEGENIIRVYRTSMNSYYENGLASENDAFRLGAEVQNTWEVSSQFTLTSVGKWEKTGVDTSNYGEKSGHSQNLSTQLKWSPNNTWTGYVGDLWTNNSQFGSNHSPRLALVYKASDEWILKTSLSKAFRVPTYNELYWWEEDQYDYNGVTYWFKMYGDPDLKPEVSKNIEVTAEYKPIKQLAFEFTLYRSLATNLISWEYISYDTEQAMNYKKSRIDGFDMSMLYNVSNQWKVGTQFHLLRAREFNETDGDYDLKINSKVPSSGALMLMYDGDKLQGTWFTRYFQGHGVSQTKIDSATISDLALSYKCTDDVVIRFGIRNVFDKDYELNAGYPMPGINYNLEFGYSF